MLGPFPNDYPGTKFKEFTVVPRWCLAPFQLIIQAQNLKKSGDAWRFSSCSPRFSAKNKEDRLPGSRSQGSTFEMLLDVLSAMILLWLSIITTIILISIICECTFTFHRNPQYQRWWRRRLEKCNKIWRASRWIWTRDHPVPNIQSTGKMLSIT